MAMKNYIKSFFSFSIGTWIRAIIVFFSTPIISYLILPEEFGRASMFTLAYNIALLVTLLGLDQSLVRYYYEEEDKNNVFWSCLFPSVILGFFVSIFFIVFEKSLSIFLYGDYYKGIGYLFAFSLLSGIFQRFNQLSIRMQKRGFLFSFINVILALGNFGGTVVFALTVSRSFYAIIFGQIIGNIFALLVGFFVDKQSRSFSKIDFEKLLEFLKYGIPFIPSSILYWLFSSIDRISLRQFSTFTEIGLYSAAFKIVSIMQLIQVGFTTFWVPLAYEKYNSKAISDNFFEKANSLISAILFIFGLLLLAFKDLIFLLFAKSYREASYIAPFLILYPIMYMLSETTVLGINFSKKTYWHIVITGVSAFVNFVGNNLLVPLLEAKGAAISTGLSYVVFFTLRTVIAQKYYTMHIKIKRIYMSVILIVIVASLGTFFKASYIYYIFCILVLLIYLLLYKDVISYVKDQMKK
ncbi:lipopolysaccharide biosynthesis protein [Thermosipho africanus H17ap60334]|nr:lipopolysaccharide biosynthesis protein [Thermosipho africanus H17ap60334]RDI90836.1 lipopolysaccharide biosynthesis protein [Thermosipho africanus Ob7]